MLFGVLSRFRAAAIGGPAVNDSVWWAAKGVGGIVTDIEEDGSFIFQCGPIVKNRKGREVPRWTVAATPSDAVWRQDLKLWVYGQGQTPKVARGIVIHPGPVLVSGKAQGSFASDD